MSAFLGFESFLIPLGSTVQNIQDTFRTAITSYGWQCVRQAVTPVATLGTLGTVANAFDLNALSEAASTAALPLWVGCQVTTAFTPTVMYISSTSNTSYAPVNFTLDWSDNGSSWTTHATWTGETTWGVRQVRKYAITSAPAKNYWRLNVTSKNGGSYITIVDFILEDASKNWITSKNFIDLCPPSSETIGNAIAKEEIRLAISSSQISITPIQELLTKMPQLILFETPTAGAVTLGVTINSITVSFTGTSGNTAIQNARGLYEAIKASTDANFLAWDWYWLNSLASIQGAGPIMATKKVATENIVVTSSNILTRLRGSYSDTMPQINGINQTPQTLTIDLINGFIYYLQINSRGLALAIKTISGFTGPIHMCYGDNTLATNQCPVSDIPSIPCTLIELLIGYDDTINNTGGFAKASHLWGIPGPYGITNTLDLDSAYVSANAWTKHAISGQVSDASTGGNTGGPNTSLTMRGEGAFSGGDSGSVYPVHRLSADPDTIWGTFTNQGGSANGRFVGPVYSDLDWYRYVGALSDEQLVFAPSTDFTTSLTADIGPTDITIPAADTTGFPTVGFIFIDNEVIQYTGKTSVSFTGCTRGRYATQASSQYNSTVISVGAWFTKINTGLLFSGYSKPA